MSRAAAILARVNQTLRKVAPLDERTAYKRTTTLTGGSSFLGRPGAVATADVVFDPQPVWEQLNEINAFQTSSGEQVMPGDYRFLFSADAYSLTDLANPSVTIVLKNSSGDTETFNIVGWDKIGFAGELISLVLYARGVKRA